MDYKNFFSRNIPERQFDNKEKIELPGGDIEVVDIKPSIQKTRVPVILGVGWGGKSDAYKNNVLSLANNGRRTIVIDAVHGIDYETYGEDAKGLPSAELRKVAALMSVLENKKINKVDAVGYSEGGIYVTLAAILHKERFRNIVLVNPGGMIGKDRETRLTLGFLQDLLRNFIKSIEGKESLKRFSSFYGGMFKSAISDVVKAVHEISAISDSQIQDFLYDLKKSGVGISIVHSTNDHAFPMSKIKKFDKPKYIDHFYSVSGSHGDFVMQAEKYTAIVDEALETMEKINNKKFELMLFFGYLAVFIAFAVWIYFLYYLIIKLT